MNGNLINFSLHSAASVMKTNKIIKKNIYKKKMNEPCSEPILEKVLCKILVPFETSIIELQFLSTYKTGDGVCHSLLVIT